MKGDTRPDIVILVFDSLRNDLFALAREFEFTLPGFEALFSIARFELSMWCGSFPTVPMRTDLLTGRLCFLDRRWDRPQADDHPWPRSCAENGWMTDHTGDNYLLWRSELGGYFQEVFQSVTRLRGVGADPYSPPVVCGTATDPESREQRLERQFSHNCSSGHAVVGDEVPRRLVARAVASLQKRSAKRRLFWIECFACHEPWVGPSSETDGGSFPRYGTVGTEVSLEHLKVQRRHYVWRLKALDNCLSSLVEALASLECSLVVLSDHGFYLGEHGYLGKPKPAPILPILGELVARTNSQALTEGWRKRGQPHELAAALAGLSGLPWPEHSDSIVTRAAQLSVVGRNSPECDFLHVLSPEGIVLFRKGGADQGFFLPWGSIDPALPFEAMVVPNRGLVKVARDFILNSFSHRAWIQEFFARRQPEVVVT
jgi:hypothetical protein